MSDKEVKASFVPLVCVAVCFQPSPPMSEESLIERAHGTNGRLNSLQLVLSELSESEPARRRDGGPDPGRGNSQVAVRQKFSSCADLGWDISSTGKHEFHLVGYNYIAVSFLFAPSHTLIVLWECKSTCSQSTRKPHVMCPVSKTT